jgi:hypothetical protein
VSGAHDRLTHALCAGTTLLGATLLFVVQPMLGKWLLPWFGGSASTWAACMVFFQGMLLVGYLYAHVLARFVPRSAQLALHGLVLAIAVAAAGRAALLEPPSGLARPELQIARLLLSQAGLSYFLLATTGPLIQRWAAAALGREPYGLYALSNAGSLLGLIAYPFAIEPRADLQAQFSAWTYAFASYAALLLLAMVRLHAARNAAVPDEQVASPAPSLRERAHWLACAFLPSALLLAVTSHITVDIASIPLLWIAPLALYLVTFIVAFSRFGLAARTPALALWLASAVGLGFGSFAQGLASLWQQLIIPCTALLSAGLLCHGELARTRPCPSRLTDYYVVIALGGALGSVAVSWIAPAVLSDVYELELSALGVLALLVLGARRIGAGERRLVYLGAGLCAPLFIASIALRAQDGGAQSHVVERRRSFLGPLKVIDTEQGRVLTHGRIRHGLQLRDPATSNTPTMYFAAGTAVERVMTRHAAERERTVGVVGLGVGTLAVFAKPGDLFRFFELDENVVELARTRFTFLRDSASSLTVGIGDGRVLLEREGPRGYDILVLDAFSSDSVPVHLLTHEAFALYARQLAPDGVLLANVSNRHLAVHRVVQSSARATRLACALVETEPDAALHRERVRWAVMARSEDQLSSLLAGMPQIAPSASPVAFTDARASLFSILER